MAGGRPTKYNKEMQAKADEYLNVFEDLGHVVPSEVGLAEWLDVATATIQKWNTDGKHPEFSGTLQRIKEKQHNLTLGKALEGKYNPTIAKMLLNVNHGYKETQAVENTVKIVELQKEFD